MANSQVIFIVCDDMIIDDNFKQFIDIQLNVYSYSLIQVKDMVNNIMKEGVERDTLFTELQKVIDEQNTQRIIIIGDAPCTSSPESDKSQHEIFLRHSVSIIRAKFQDKEISAYLNNTFTNSFDQIA